MDVAWVLFDGLQTDPETVRMIRDIQLKNPGGLSDQVHRIYTYSKYIIPWGMDILPQTINLIDLCFH